MSFTLETVLGRRSRLGGKLEEDKMRALFVPIPPGSKRVISKAVAQLLDVKEAKRRTRSSQGGYRRDPQQFQ